MGILHTMIRVGDLDRSIAFYTEILGTKIIICIYSCQNNVSCIIHTCSSVKYVSSSFS